MQPSLETHMRRTISAHALVAAVAVTTLFTSANADMPDSLAVVPQNAFVAIGTKPFNQLDRELSQLLVGAEITTLSNLGQVLRIIGLDKGFDQTRGLAFAGFENPNFQPPLTASQPDEEAESDQQDNQNQPSQFSFVAYLPTTQSTDLLDSLNGTPANTDNLTAFTFAGESYLAAPAKGNYLAIATQEWALLSALESAGDNPKRNATLSKRAQRLTTTADIVLYLGSASRDRTIELMREANSMLTTTDSASSESNENQQNQQNQDSQLNQEQAAQLAEFTSALEPLVEQGDSLTITLDATPLGLRADAIVSLNPQSEAASLTSEIDSPNAPLRLLHASDELTLAFAADLRSTLSKQLLTTLLEQDLDESSPDSVAIGLYRASRLPIDPVDAVIRWSSETPSATSRLIQSATQEQLTFTPNQHTVGNTTLDGWRITPDPKSRFTLPFQGTSGQVPGGGAFTLSPDAAFTSAVATHNPANSPGAEQTLLGIQLLRQQLPAQPAIEVYLNTKPIFEFALIKPLLSSRGFEPSLPANLPPVAAGIAFRDNSIHLGTFISTQNIKNLFTLYQALN